MEIFELVFSLAQSTLRFTPILIFAAMAGVFSERAGIIDIGLEGKLLIGACRRDRRALRGLWSGRPVCRHGGVHGLRLAARSGHDHLPR